MVGDTIQGKTCFEQQGEGGEHASISNVTADLFYASTKSKSRGRYEVWAHGTNSSHSLWERASSILARRYNALNGMPSRHGGIDMPLVFQNEKKNCSKTLTTSRRNRALCWVQTVCCYVVREKRSVQGEPTQTVPYMLPNVGVRTLFTVSVWSGRSSWLTPYNNIRSDCLTVWKVG